jgi:hypothetical protein
MGKLYGHAPNTIVPQDDFNAAQNENGGWKATQSFRIRKGDIDNYSVKEAFPSGATLQSLDKSCDDLFAFMRLATIKGIQNIPGGWQQITVEFVGFTNGSTSEFTPPETAARPTYGKRGTLKDAPLYEHPKWKALEPAERWALGLFLKGDFQSNSALNSVGTYEEYDLRKTFYPAIDNDGDAITFSEDAIKFIERIAQGRTTYEMATYQHHHRWQGNKGITSAQLNKLGKIDTPSGNPPTPGTGRDWLLIGADEEQNGSGDFLFDNVLTYLLSDEGGHDDFLQS